MPSQRDRAKWAARREFEKVLKTLGPGDIAIDCGANVGKFTEKMARTGATVYAFEPDPYCVEILREKFSDIPNIKIFARAVGVENATVEFFRHLLFEQNAKKYSESSSTCRTKANLDLGAPLSVVQIDLLQFINALGCPVKILKMDIEGSEVDILEEMLSENTIVPVENIFVETHERIVPDFLERVIAVRQAAAAQKTVYINLDWE